LAVGVASRFVGLPGCGLGATTRLLQEVAVGREGRLTEILRHDVHPLVRLQRLFVVGHRFLGADAAETARYILLLLFVCWQRLCLYRSFVQVGIGGLL
jgi:hypothetical protein